MVDQRFRPGGLGFYGIFASVDPSLQVFDKSSGGLLVEIPLPSNASGSPLTYSYRGKQYIVIALGGGNVEAELVALSL